MFELNILPTRVCASFSILLVVFPAAAAAAAGCEANKEIYSTCANSHTHTHICRQSQLNAILHGILKNFLLCPVCCGFFFSRFSLVFFSCFSRCFLGANCVQHFRSGGVAVSLPASQPACTFYFIMRTLRAASNNNNENRF